MARSEGSKGPKGNLRVSVPIAIGVKAPDWYTATVNGVSFLAFVRAPPSRPYPTFTLPIWAFPGLVPGSAVSARLEPPERASGHVPGWDWLPLAPERCFPTDDGEDLLLNSRYEAPFRLRRTPRDIEAHYRLLGYYQAEGSKADTGADWSFASSLIAPAEAVLSSLPSWGIGRDRCYAEVLHGPDESPEAAQAYFAPLGVEVAAARPRTGRGGHAVVLHIRSSSLLREMTVRALRQITFPSPEVALAYALGWLDGDGSITIERSTIRLTLSGLEDEHLVVQEAFRVAFGWERRGRGWLDNKQGTHIRLRLAEVVQLLEAGAFPYSMSRAKLLLAFDKRTENLRRFSTVASRLGGATWAVRHGLLEPAPVRGYQLTDEGLRIVEAHGRLLPEIEAVRAVAPPGGIVRRKGVPYPEPAT